MANLHLNKNYKAIRTGEFRQPKKGEYYLSGAIIEAYRADNDLLSKYYIAMVVPVLTSKN